MASPNPNPISRAAAEAAVDALLKWLRSRAKQRKAQLLEHDDLLYLVLTVKRIPPKGRTNPYRIPIPHPVHPLDPASTSICLIADDRPSSPLSPSAALARLQSESLPISSVIGISDLRSDYRPFESRRRLCDSYDLFFADRKILPLLPRLLGKHFFKTKKIPLAVDLSRIGWPEQIRSVCGSTLMYLRTGTCSGLKIGRASMDRDEIVENVMVAIEKAVELVPKKWGNVRSFHVKSVDSVALPIYQALPEMGLKIEGVWDGEMGKDGILMGGKKELGEEKMGRKKKRIHEVGGDDGREEQMGLEIEGVGDGESDKDGILIGEEKKGRKHVDNDGVGGDDGEKRVRKKVKKNAEGDGEFEGSRMKKKGKNGLKKKKENDALMMNRDDDVDVDFGEFEEEKMSGDLGVEDSITKKKRKKDGVVRKVGKDKQSGGKVKTGEGQGDDLLSGKKKMRKGKKTEENAIALLADEVMKNNKDAVAHLGEKKKSSQGKASQDPVVKKIKRSKVRSEIA